MRRENRTSIKNATIVFELNNKHNLLARTAPGRPFLHHAILLQLRNFSEDYADTVTRPLSVDQLLICNALRRCPMYGSGPVVYQGHHSFVGSSCKPHLTLSPQSYSHAHFCP